MSTMNDVGIVLDRSLKDGLVDKIILVKLLVGDLVFNIINAYTPQIGLNEGAKMQLWEELDALVSSVSISEKLLIRDLNGHVGSTRAGFDGVHGGFGYGSRNQEGEGILNFTLTYDLFVVNTLFRKRVFQDGPWLEGGDANCMWIKMATCIRKMSSEEFRVTKGGKGETKETWW
jgi:hypothetical protein